MRDELAAAGEPAQLPPAARPTPAYYHAQRQIVEEQLERAERAVEPARLLRSVQNWYSGAAVESAWTSLHRASEALLMIQSPLSLPSEFADIEAAFETNVNPGDPRRESLAKALKEARKILVEGEAPEQIPQALRAKLRAARRAANVASDTAHASVRRWRNVLLLAALALGSLAVAVAVVHIWAPAFVSLKPSGVSGRAPEPWEVELIGALGGALAAVLALNGFSGFTDPSGLPTTQAWARIPTAMVTSLFGVILMQTKALDILTPQTGTTVLAYAFVFGYAQEPLLRMIDRQAGKVLDPARGKDEPVNRPSGEAGEGRRTAD